MLSLLQISLNAMLSYYTPPLPGLVLVLVCFIIIFLILLPTYKLQLYIAFCSPVLYTGLDWTAWQCTLKLNYYVQFTCNPVILVSRVPWDNSSRG